MITRSCNRASTAVQSDEHVIDHGSGNPYGATFGGRVFPLPPADRAGQLAYARKFLEEPDPRVNNRAALLEMFENLAGYPYGTALN